MREMLQKERREQLPYDDRQQEPLSRTNAREGWSAKSLQRLDPLTFVIDE